MFNTHLYRKAWLLYIWTNGIRGFGLVDQMGVDVFGTGDQMEGDIWRVDVLGEDILKLDVMVLHSLFMSQPFY